MSSLSSMPKRAIISIQPDPESPFEFVDRNTAENIINSRHVGGKSRLARKSRKLRAKSRSRRNRTRRHG